MIGDEHHGHARHTGLPWLDLVLAGSAVVVSVVSLVVSIGHGRTMEKLVETNALQVRASTLPILRFFHGNVEDDRIDRLNVHLDLLNGGTGPAMIQWLTLSSHGAVAADPVKLLEVCCGDTGGRAARTALNNIATGQTLPAGKTSVLFSLPRPSPSSPVWEILNARGRQEVRARACYCSVLDECWITDFGREAPRQVKTCGPPPPGAW